MQARTHWWKKFEDKHRTVAQFIVFFILSNGITVLQLVLMPAFKAAFAHTGLVDTALQFLPVGVSHGHTVYLFDYPSGALAAGGGEESHTSWPWRSRSSSPRSSTSSPSVR